MIPNKKICLQCGKIYTRGKYVSQYMFDMQRYCNIYCREDRARDLKRIKEERK